MDNEKRDINEIKKELSNELLESIRNSHDGTVLETLLLHGYSYEEITDLLPRYTTVSGLDLYNCNETAKSVLHR